MLLISFIVMFSLAAAHPLSAVGVLTSRDAQDSVAVGQDLWGFIWPVGSQFMHDPQDWQSFQVGKEIDVTFITPFETTRLEVQTTDGRHSQIISDAKQGPTIKWVVSTAGLPGKHQTLQLRLTSPSSTDAHAGLSLVSAPFNVTVVEPSVFGPAARWSLGILVAMLFAVVMLVVGLFAALTACMRRRRRGASPDEGGSIEAYVRLDDGGNNFVQRKGGAAIITEKPTVAAWDRIVPMPKLMYHSRAGYTNVSSHGSQELKVESLDRGS